MGNITLHIVNHTHWDREWQKTFSEYRTRLIKFMDDLIDTMEDDKTFGSFMLDGQTSLVDDYLIIKPEMKGRLKRLVQSKKIIIGPWYVQPDEFIPSGESLLRNLLIGEFVSKQYGHKMKVGYLPDSFGQSRFIPQILNQFEIEYAVAMRGFDKSEIENNEFIWESPDGSQVICSVLWAGYNNGAQLTENVEGVERCINNNVVELIDGSYDRNILILAGSDQAMVKRYMPSLIEKLNRKYSDITFKQSSLEEYFDVVSINKNNLIKLKGDFRKPYSQRVHISIAGSRTDVKQRNYQIQTFMEKVVEPISTIGYTFQDRYEPELLIYCWKKIIENHAHDSICNVCTDEVHRDMLARINEVENTLQALKKARINNLVEKIKFKVGKNIKPIIVFNMNGFESEQYVDAVVDVYTGFKLLDDNGNNVDYIILDEDKINLKDYRLWLKENPDDIVTRTKIKFKAKVRGIGYRTYYLNEDISFKSANANEEIEITERSVANKYLEMNVNDDGTINLIDKAHGISKYNLFELIDEGNGGDSYDYSPPLSDEKISSKLFKSEISVYKPNYYEGAIKVKKTMLVNYSSNQKGRSDKKVNMDVEITFTLNALNNYIDIDVNVNNTAKNHRLSLLIPNFTHHLHMREGSFGDVPAENICQEGNVIEKGWKEYYYPVYSTQRYVYDKNSKLALFNRGVQGYEIVDGADLKVHLFTTSDYMGKTNLKYRPGRRSGAKIKTKDSLLLGNINFQFRLEIFEREDLIYKDSDEYQNPMFSQYVHKKHQQGYISDEISFFSSFDTRVVTSALVRSPYGDEIIWRIKNMQCDYLNDILLFYNSNLFNFECEVNMLDHRVEDRVLDESVSDYIGEEYEGSGDVLKSGILRVTNIKPNEVINLKFSKRL